MLAIDAFQEGGKGEREKERERLKFCRIIPNPQ